MFHIMNKAQPYPGTQAVLRAVAVLKAFTDDQPELGLAEVARIAGLNRTTAFRLLTALESEGMVTRSASAEGYRLGPEAIALGGRAIRSNTLRTASHDELERLAEATRESATLEVLAGTETLIIDEVLGQFLVGATPSIGTRWPAHTTSTGKAILAHLPVSDLPGALPRRLPTPTANSIASRDLLAEELDLVARQGYAIAIDELELGFAAISAPLFNHERRVVAAISVGGASARLSRAQLKALAPSIVSAAERISRRLGFQ